MGPWGSSTDLEKSVWHQVVAGRPGHMAGQPGGMASTDFLHCLGLLLLVQTIVLRATGQTDIKHGRSAGPWALLAWGLTHSVHVSNRPRGDDDFDIWSTLLCHPLKCSNLLPKFLKSNKH
jgi:hypothetical protein